PWQTVVGAGPGRPVVRDGDGQAGHQVGSLPGPLDQRLSVHLSAGDEDLPVRPEPRPRAGTRLGNLAKLAQAGFPLEGRAETVTSDLAGHAAPETDRPFVAAPVNVHIAPAREGVHDGSADAVQPTGGCVGAAAELAARVQSGHDQLDAVQARLR